MKRRTVVAAVGATSIGVSGCSSSVGRLSGNEKNGYQACGEPIIVFRDLPDDVQREVETAFEEGECEKNGEFLYEQVRGESVKALRRNDFFYEAHVNEKLLGGRTLSFTQTAMRYDSPVDLEIRNMMETDWKGTVVVYDVDGEQLVLAEDVTIESYPTVENQNGVDPDDDRIEQFSVTDEWGEYRVRLDADQEAYEDYDEARQNSFYLENSVGKYYGRDFRIVITEDGAIFDDNLGRRPTDEDFDSPDQPCVWNEAKEVVMGTPE